MRNKSQKIAFAIALVLTGAQFVPSLAHAQYFDDEDDGFRQPPRFENGRQRNWDRQPPRDDYYQQGCSRRDVVEAARDEGFRRIDSIQMTPRRIIVQGWNKGGPDRMAFANRPGCPTIGGF